MQLTLIHFLIVCPLVFLAGFVDSIAGGGGLISLPAYVLAGVPIHMAIGTNKMSSCIGTTVSTARYVKNKYADIGVAIPCILIALTNSVIGAKISMRVDAGILEKMLLIILPITAYFVLFKKKEPTTDSFRHFSRKTTICLAVISSAIVGLYDGFYGPGTGTFLILLYTNLCGMDLKSASGNTKLVNLTSNIAALITFLLHGKTVVLLGIVAGFFCMAGHYLGSGLVLTKGTKIVKPIIVVVLILLFIKIIVQML